MGLCPGAPAEHGERSAGAGLGVGREERLRRDLLAFINTDVSLDPTTEVQGDTDLLLTGLVDSVGVIEIVTWLEEVGGVEIDPIDVVLENFQTVDAMLGLVDRLQAERRT